MLTHYNDEQVEIVVYEQSKPGENCSGDIHVVI
ncbi:hypothetical protein BkAM31D_01360 [Halalkalibacter krulwichiae]|uniref:Uncharacterized protein n=1 Tax=Halalkalibacter krulwichiae TaxID=199441 RepID=A0A1Y9THG5_9BACI|nr:hypothetical protein BkAM31D_01360 [Halalkalibacter krulwichiae]